MSDSLSILYVNPTRQLRTGIKTLSEGLASEAIVTVLTPTGTRSQITEHPDVEYVYYDPVYVPSVRYTLPTISFLRKLSKYAAKADVVHIYSYFYPVCTAAVLEARRRGTPAIVTIDSLPGVNWKTDDTVVDSIARIYTETLGRVTFSRANAVVALGDYLLDPVDKYVSPKKRTVIPNGIDIDRFSPSENVADDSSESVSLLFVGRLDPVKGVPYLLRAMWLIAEQADEPYRLTIVGDGTKETEYKRLCEELEIRELVSFEGYRDDLVPYYRSHDLCVLPSISEGQPTVLMEAQACGTPVIATDVGDSSNIVEAGRVVPPKEPDALAEAITSFDPDASGLRERAREHVLTKHSKRNMCGQYKELYNSIIEDERSR